MHHHFCTLFDRNYLNRGLSLYNSLLRNVPDFTLWVLAMDQITYDVLAKMQLKNMRLVRLEDLEDDELRRVKPTRNVGEYCWTLSSSLPLFIFKIEPQVDQIAYLDSDLYFYSPIQPIYDELGDASIAIIRHNYSEQLKYLEKRSGIYNVSMVVFKRDENALACLKWWRGRCLEWCYSYYEDGKLGDQMYLDDWTERFKNVHVVKHKGANVAPWNINRYVVSEKQGQIFVDEDPLIFYHFHSLKVYGPQDYHLYYSTYNITPDAEKLIYPPYVAELEKVMQMIRATDPQGTYGYSGRPTFVPRAKYELKRLVLKVRALLFKV